MSPLNDTYLLLDQQFELKTDRSTCDFLMLITKCCQDALDYSLDTRGGPGHNRCFRLGVAWRTSREIPPIGHPRLSPPGRPPTRKDPQGCYQWTGIRFPPIRGISAIQLSAEDIHV